MSKKIHVSDLDLGNLCQITFLFFDHDLGNLCQSFLIFGHDPDNS